MNWNPFTITEIQTLLNGNDDWFIVGGVSIDIYLGRATRGHEDIDIGVLSIHALKLFSSIKESGLNVFSASNGELVEYSEDDLNLGLDNFWVSDDHEFKMQVLVYKVEGNNVPFRRLPEIKWDIKTFILNINDLRIINPVITLAFKLTANPILKKDIMDINNLSQALGA